MWNLLPAIVAALASSHSHAPQLEAPARALQTHTQDAGGRLAAALADASAIDWVAANDSTITFGIERGDATLRLTVTVRDAGAISSFAVVPVDGASHTLGARGVLSWLGGELRDAPAISRLDVDAEGIIALRTSDGRRYRALPARIAGGNAAVEARWAAEWDGDGNGDTHGDSDTTGDSDTPKS
jgi:hypothetical protein